VLCDLPDSQYKRRLKRKFLSIYADKALGYYTLADGTMKIILAVISEGVIQLEGCNFGTRRLLFNLVGYTLRVPKPVKDEFEARGLKAAPICIHGDSAAIGASEPAAVCAMLTRTMQLPAEWAGTNWGWNTGTRRSLYTNRIVRRTSDQASVAADLCRKLSTSPRRHGVSSRQSHSNMCAVR
jgi:hypothetical protein